MKKFAIATATIFALIPATALIAVPASAAEVDVTKVLKSPNGEALTDCDKYVDDTPQKGCEPGKTVPLTIGRLIILLANQREYDAAGHVVEMKVSDLMRRGHLIDKVSPLTFPRFPLATSAPHTVNLDDSMVDLIDEKLPKSGVQPYTATQLEDALHPPATK